MRIAVAGPMVGHVLPLLPLTGAFACAGHDVVVAATAAGVDAPAVLVDCCARCRGTSVGCTAGT